MMKNSKLVLLAFILLAGIFSAKTQVITNNSSVKDILESRGEIYFRFPVSTLGNNVMDKVSVDKVKDGYVYAYASAAQFSEFLKAKSVYEILTAPSLLNPDAIVMASTLTDMQNWDKYPVYDLYVQMMKKFATDYPAICKLDTIGFSKNNRALIALKISDSVQYDQPEPEFFYTATIHGDETTGYILMLRLADYLLSNYGANSRVNSIVNNMEIWINPLANPDGTFKTSNSTIVGSVRYNANSIDLNRNFPDPRFGDHPDGNQWQPENIAMMNFAGLHNFTMSANLHGGAELINYPFDTWAATTKTHADDPWWSQISRAYADTVHANSVTGYLTDESNGITNGGTWYVITGGRQDYMNWWQKCREVTMELSTDKTLSSNLLPAHWNYNYKSLLNYLEEARFGIHGVVTDSLTGLSLKARVFINNHDRDSSHVYSTALNGDYHRPVLAGTYSVTFSAPGYNSKTISNVSVQNHQTINLNVPLSQSFSGINMANRFESQLYPNPANDNIVVKISNPVKWIRIYDLLGNLIYMQNGEQESLVYTINTGQWVTGIYSIHLESSDSVYSSKFVVLH